MNARQAAEYRDEIARMRATAAADRRRQARAEAAARPKRPYKRRPAGLPPRSMPQKPPTAAQQALADRLLAHVSRESVVDRRQHALGVARMILQGRR